MRYFAITLLCLGSFLPWLPAQTQGEDEIVAAGDKGVVAPKALRRVEPEFTSQARHAQIQGTVILSIVIEKNGHPSGIRVLSPIGFGLDESAVDAVSKWEFVPAQKDGRPTRMSAIVEVNFRFPEIWFDEKMESRRSRHNLATQELTRKGAKPEAITRSVRTLETLAAQRFPASMCVVGQMKMKGEHLERNEEEGWKLVQKAAEKNYGPALYEVGRQRLEGRLLPRDEKQGLQDLRDAAIMGSSQAQFALGGFSEEGIHGEKDLSRAARYYRLCAAQGFPECQYRLGRLLLNGVEGGAPRLPEAVAYLELASDGGVNEAEAALKNAKSALKPGDEKSVKSLKSQLLRR